jgi:hypothetical protein
VGLLDDNIFEMLVEEKDLGERGFWGAIYRV